MKMIRKEEKRNQVLNKQVINKLKKTITTCTIFTLLFFSNMNVAYASDIGQKAGEWVIKQIFWVGLAALAIALVGLVIKRNLVQAAITGIGGGIVLFFVANPEKLSSLGEMIANAMQLGV